MSGNAKLDAVERQPRLSDRVAEDIVRTIVAQRMKPGDALPPERELGEQFGVSRTVIREAVRALDARGLLDVRVGSRIKVAAVDPNTVEEAIWHFGRSATLDARTVSEVGEALEVAAAGLAAEHATKEDLERIASALARLEGARDDPAAGAEADLAVRQAVVGATHNELLIVLAGAVAMLSSAPPHTAAPDRRVERHRALAAAIGQRDVDGARRAMRERLEHRGADGTGDG